MTKFKAAVAAILLVVLSASAALGQAVPYKNAVSAIMSASSGNVAAATATATLPTGLTTETVFICGFAVTSLGSTATAVVALTVTGVNGGTQTYNYVTVAGVTTQNPSFIVNFSACIPATGPNVAIAVSLPSLGGGNTNAAVNAWGFRY